MKKEKIVIQLTPRQWLEQKVKEDDTWSQIARWIYDPDKIMKLYRLGGNREAVEALTSNQITNEQFDMMGKKAVDDVRVVMWNKLVDSGSPKAMEWQRKIEKFTSDRAFMSLDNYLKDPASLDIKSEAMNRGLYTFDVKNPGSGLLRDLDLKIIGCQKTHKALDCPVMVLMNQKRPAFRYGDLPVFISGDKYSIPQKPVIGQLRIVAYSGFEEADRNKGKYFIQLSSEDVFQDIRNPFAEIILENA
jgi:hypothetical protein